MKNIRLTRISQLPSTAFCVAKRLRVTDLRSFGDLKTGPKVS